MAKQNFKKKFWGDTPNPTLRGKGRGRKGEEEGGKKKEKRKGKA